MADGATTVTLHPEVRKLAKDFALTGGRLVMPRAAFAKWSAAHAALPAEQREARGVDLVALAARFQREGGLAAMQAVAQIALLCAQVLGRSNAQRAFKSAGLGWAPKQPKSSKGWGRSSS